MTQIAVDYELLSSTLAKSAKKSLGDAETIIKKFLTQAARDALSGTFGEYTSNLFALLPGEYDRFQAQCNKLTGIVNETEDEDLRKGRLQFTLKLDADTFADSSVGLQHLIGILVGDMFSRSRSAIDPNARVTAKRVDIGIAKKVYETAYVSRSHSIHQLRDLFRLDGTGTPPLRLPLMAFSFKPRIGFSKEFIRRVTLGVLQAGFNLVELDTRNLQTTASDWCEFFIRLATEATKISTHVARFSPNLSMPAAEAIALAERFKDAHPAGTPWVIKVDGGLDGLSTIQAIRRHFDKEQPIITGYPLLHRALEDRIGRDTLLDFLTLSGADIIYPGGTPRLSPKSAGIDLQQVEPGYNRYWRIIDSGRPMPSIAGGIHAGQLAAYHEMFGPSVAYFLGGAVALHKRGAFSRSTNPKRRAGAELCMEVIKDVADLEHQAEPNYSGLLSKFGSARDEYANDPHFSTDQEQWEYQDPARYIKGSIKRYVSRPQ